MVSAGNPLHVVERPFPAWPLSRLSAVLFSRTVDIEVARECLSLPLVPSWRRTLERRIEKSAVEDWSPRLQGPDHAGQA
ncbi:3-alpha domain protein [compost metagenome]